MGALSVRVVACITFKDFCRYLTNVGLKQLYSAHISFYVFAEVFNLKLRKSSFLSGTCSRVTFRADGTIGVNSVRIDYKQI